MEKLNELVELAERADYVGNLMGAVNPHTILAVAEAFRALEQRAEAAEAKLATIESNHTAVVLGPPTYWRQGGGKLQYTIETSEPFKNGTELFTRHVPAADLAELVPPERNKWEGTDEEGYDIDYMEPSDIYQMGKDEGFNLCRAAILRKIEEAK